VNKLSIIQVKDKSFELSITEEEILTSIRKLAEKINAEMKGKKPLFICILNGAFMFASDLLKEINIPCEITFIRLKSYYGMNSVGKIKEVHELIEDIKDRNIVIVEDIIDTGYTIRHLLQQMQEKKPKSIKVATLLFKPAALQLDIKPDYVAMEIPNEFIVGYGLDYDGEGRNLRDIYKVKN
jgi:hypoxanthine phosphoribosyltransferase